MPVVAVQKANPFLDPAGFSSVSVYDLLEAAASGHTGIDQRFIHAIVDRGTAGIPELMRFAMDDRSTDAVNLEEDLIAIFRFLQAPEALPFYLNCIRQNPEDVTDELIDAIIPFGAQAVEPLLKLYEELGEEQGGDVAFLLAATGTHDPRILKILVDRLEYDAGEAALALSLYRDPEANTAIEQMLAKIPEEDGGLRRDLQMAIDSASVPKGEETTAAPEPFDIWDLYPETSPPPVELLTEADLLEMLSGPSAEYRSEAAISFRNRSEYSPQVRDRLLEVARTDSDIEVRGSAWEALGEKADEPPIRKALKAVLADEKASLRERTGALVGLAGASDDKKIAEQIRQFYENPETRAKALEAMWRSFDRQFADYFPKHLADPDQAVRRAAIWGVGYLGSGSHAGTLAAMFEDDEYRADALFAYALNVPSEISHGRIPALFRKINEAAGGLSYGEAELVQTALDQRLVMHGLEPYFANSDEEPADWDEEAEEQEEAPGPRLVTGAGKDAAPASKVGRNDLCPCGSGKKYKKCHGA
jgi:HEAT repeat protein